MYFSNKNFESSSKGLYYSQIYYQNYYNSGISKPGNGSEIGINSEYSSYNRSVYGSTYGTNFVSDYTREGIGYSSYNNQKKVKWIFGFQNNNLSNNCFMNSSLQNILHCEMFINLMRSIQDYKLTNKPLAREIKKIINQIDKGKDELDPSNIKSILSEVEEKYKYNEQNDANEFITIFLNQLLKELIGVGIENYKLCKVPNNELEKNAFYKLENRFFEKNKSFLLNLFYGRLKREYICVKEHVCLVKFNKFNTLILPQPVKSNKIIDLLKLYQDSKAINDTIFCQICKKDVKYSIKTKIYSIPKYFILCLEKESFYYHSSQSIDYPINLKTEDFMENHQGSYELKSLIEYSGNRKAGHYKAKVCQDKQ